MANTRFGNFSELSQGKKPMSAKEAWAMLNELALMGQEFVPGAVSIRKVFEGKPREAVEELQDWIPGNAAYQNFIRGKDQDWVRNALDLAIVGKPLAKGAKKAMEAIERMPKGGKEGFLTLSTDLKHTTANTVLKDSGLTGRNKKQFEEYAKNMNKAINDGSLTITQKRKLLETAENIAAKADDQTREAMMAFDNAIKTRLIVAHGGTTVNKPAGFNSWPAKDRLKWVEEHPEINLDLIGDEEAKNMANIWKLGPDKGAIFEDFFHGADARKLKKDLELERPIETTQVEDMSTGILPGNVTKAPQGGHRNTYDHSRTFMDSELKQVPGIDRTGMSYGDDTDAFYDLYKAWRDNPGEEKQAIHDIITEAKSRPAKRTIMHTDPYYNAGVVGDLNNKLWKSINDLRGRGYSDEIIRTVLKSKLDEYQGKLERFKARMPSKNKNAIMTYDGALTNTLKALPSEEARALKALGVDTPEYDELERLGNFYRVFFPK